MTVRRIGPRNKRTRTPKKTKKITSAGGNGAMATELREGADTTARLLRDIKANRLDPRDLSATQRRACLLLLANGTQTSGEMAAMFGVKPSTIRTDLQRLRETLGREVKEWTLTEVLGDLALAADKCSAQAMRQEDPGLSWTIRRDFAKLLREFGVIGSDRDRNALTITLEGIGEGYERARAALSRGLDPRLTGEVIDVEATVSDDPDRRVPPPLPLDRRLTDMARMAGEERDEHENPETETESEEDLEESLDEDETED